MITKITTFTNAIIAITRLVSMFLLLDDSGSVFIVVVVVVV